MKTHVPNSPLSILAAAALLCTAVPALAGSYTTDKQVTPPAPPEEPYEANRGLLTLQGPTGLFINPTSATLPQGAFTAQYCFFLPDFDFQGTIGHGALVAYGITDWLEVGALALFLTDTPSTQFAAGPEVRVRLLKHDGWIPQVSVGGFGRIGDDAAEEAAAYAALTERFEVKAGPLESIALHAGVRQSWYNGFNDFHGYWGVDIQLPARFYIVGEISTKAFDEHVTPWAAGIQWRAGGINISASALQNGRGGDPGFFFGIGTQF